MEKTLQIINQMQKEGVFRKYAIGGAIAAIFYMETITTYDLDVFIIIDAEEKKILTLTPIYDWVKKKGYQTQGEHIKIEGIPVQFIPVYNELIREAVENARQDQYSNVETFVVDKEYLLAIMLQTNRPKDNERINRFIEEAELNEEILIKILKKHNLYQQFLQYRT